jgi:type I restriction enzyme, S subunit
MWQYTTIGGLCDATNGTVQTGPFGSDLHASDYGEYGTPVIMPANLGKNTIIEEGIARVADTHVVRLSNHKIIRGDIVFPRRGDVARYVVVDDRHVGWLCGTGCLRIRFGENEIIEPEFLGYWLGTSIVEGWLLSNAVGTTMPNLNTSILKSLPVPLPPIDEQREIAHILGVLDDKIELNKRVNTTLESTTRAIFKSWFVDFDPVRAKAKGRQPEGMDAETAALFPDSFQESKLGLIPEGWEVVSIGDEVHIKHGYAFEGQYFSPETSDDILLTPGNFAIGGGFKGDKFKYYSGPVPEEYVLREDDLLVTMTDLSKAGDTLGYPALIPKPEKYRFLHNQRLGKVVIKPTSVISKLFLYYLMQTDNYRQEILGSATGSTVKHTSPNRIQAFAFAFPSPQIMKRFDDLAVSLYSGIKVNEQMALTLAETRDVLLPKLISGEVRVNNPD